jgi:signal transduction histidine kinase/CheY-like chemotaxis protein
MFDRTAAWISATTFRSIAVRYLGTVITMLAVIALSANAQLRDSAWIIVIVAVVACSWFGGVGPSIVAPFLLIMSVRFFQKDNSQIFDFSRKEIADLCVLLLLTTAIGWSGQARRRAQRLARRQAIQLREEAARKDQFLATLAHELRNPLAPLRSGLEILELAGDDLADKEMVRDVRETMKRQVDSLVRLVDDLLDAGRINSGKIELRRERVRLADVLRDAVDAAQPNFQTLGHEFQSTIHDSDLVIWVDPVRISQVLLNLLNNAAKFTPQHGKIELWDSRDGDALEIHVKDNGIGIPGEMLPKIFDMFAQLDYSKGRSRGGLGLGLSIARTLVEMHGGTVTVKSEGPGRGSEFVVRLPQLVEQGARKPEDLSTARGATDPARLRRVLVVDDNADAARSLATCLTMKGHDCQTAYCGDDALETVSNFAPDAVILDLGMPGMDGYQVVARMRSMLQNPPPVLIAVTGWGQPDDHRRSQAAGFDHHLVKPVDVDVLQNLLTSRA